VLHIPSAAAVQSKLGSSELTLTTRRGEERAASARITTTVRTLPCDEEDEVAEVIDGDQATPNYSHTMRYSNDCEATSLSRDALM
jgi:hypothetical protein